MNYDGAADDKKKRDKEAKEAAERKAQKSSESEKKIEYGGSKGTFYGTGGGNVFQTTGGHRSTAGPSSSKRQCVSCGKLIPKSMTKCNGC